MGGENRVLQYLAYINLIIHYPSAQCTLVGTRSTMRNRTQSLTYTMVAARKPRKNGQLVTWSVLWYRLSRKCSESIEKGIIKQPELVERRGQEESTQTGFLYNRWHLSFPLKGEFELARPSRERKHVPGLGKDFLKGRTVWAWLDMCRVATKWEDYRGKVHREPVGSGKGSSLYFNHIYLMAFMHKRLVGMKMIYSLQYPFSLDYYYSRMLICLDWALDLSGILIHIFFFLIVHSKHFSSLMKCFSVDSG